MPSQFLIYRRPPRYIEHFIAVEEFVQLPEFSYLTKSSLRHLIYNSEHRYSAAGDVVLGNGLVEAGAIIRIGRRILIDADKFREWVLGQRQVPAQA